MASTHRIIYKTDAIVGDIDAIIHVPTLYETNSMGMPVAIVFHGGGWVVGSADSVPEIQISALLERGFVVIAPNFRLCPQVSLFCGPMKDAADCLEWCQDEHGLAAALKKRGGIVVDRTRIVAIGHSSGGHLALTLGSAKHPPNAILDFYGPKDFEDAFFSSPLEVLSSLPDIDRDFIENIHSDKKPRISFSEQLFTSSGPNLTTPRTAWQIQKMKQGTHLREVVLDCDYNRVDPIEMIKAKGKNWPPTCFIHGTDDVLVPFRVTERAAKLLREVGVAIELVRIEGGQHGFDAALDSTDSKDWLFVARGFAFLERRVSPRI